HLRSALGLRAGTARLVAGRRLGASGHFLRLALHALRAVTHRPLLLTSFREERAPAAARYGSSGTPTTTSALAEWCGSAAGGRSVAGRAAGVGVAAGRSRGELPVVAAGMEGEQEDAEGCVLAFLAERLGRGEGMEVLAARADDELADAALRVGSLARRLRSETLVAVGVPIEHDVCARPVQVLPEHGGVRVVSDNPRGEARVVPEGERAQRRVGFEVGPKPPLLGRACAASADAGAVGVERDQVPRANLERVVPAARISGRRPEIAEVAARGPAGV